MTYEPDAAGLVPGLALVEGEVDVGGLVTAILDAERTRREALLRMNATGPLCPCRYEYRPLSEAPELIDGSMELWALQPPGCRYDPFGWSRYVTAPVWRENSISDGWTHFRRIWPKRSMAERLAMWLRWRAEHPLSLNLFRVGA